MASDEERARWLERVRRSLEDAGHHVTLVTGGVVPRFAYTLGLTEIAGHEAVLAGATSLTGRDVKQVLAQSADVARAGELAPGSKLDIEGLGTFAVGSVDQWWSEALVLGALTLYGKPTSAVQLVPEGDLRTIDVPDLSRRWDPELEPVWRWLRTPWPYEIAPESVSVTNLDALRGAPVSEAARWEPTEWELFAGAGPDVPRNEIRVVPLATLLAFDPSLEAVTRLDPGQALRRVPPGPWERWGE